MFFGHRDVSISDGAPPAVRIFYPSIDGTPEGAPFLADCGRYPLVLFLHGQCNNEPDHFFRWFEFPAALARGGYVVVVPDFGGLTDPLQDSHLEQAQTVISWMRDQWEHRDQLGEDTCFAGHSFGGVLAGRVAATGLASAYVSLSGAWISVILRLDILNALGASALFMWGTDDDPVGGDLDAQLDGEQIFQWNKVQPPKHRVRFIGGPHFDYLKPGQSACVSSGPCSLVSSVAAHVAALFLSGCMPPPDAGIPKKSIDVSLTLPPLSLTRAQEFFVGGHLGGLKATISVVDPSVTAAGTPRPAARTSSRGHSTNLDSASART